MKQPREPTCELVQYRETKQMQDLEASIQSVQRAVEFTPIGHSDRLDRLVNFGKRLQLRYQERADMKDFERALQMAREVVGLVGEDCKDRVAHLIHLADLAKRRYERIREPQDLEEAIKIMRQAIQTTRQAIDLLEENQNAAPLWKNLANYLKSIYEYTQDIQYLEESI